MTTAGIRTFQKAMGIDAISYRCRTRLPGKGRHWEQSVWQTDGCLARIRCYSALLCQLLALRAGVFHACILQHSFLSIPLLPWGSHPFSRLSIPPLYVCILKCQSQAPASAGTPESCLSKLLFGSCITQNLLFDQNQAQLLHPNCSCLNPNLESRYLCPWNCHFMIPLFLSTPSLAH